MPPLPETAAVDLFVRRVRDVQADFARTDENAPAITELCARLDGLPLALELAARRIKTYGAVEALLAALAPALPELTGGPRDAPARQRTMRAAIAWSYGLLDDDERSLFRRLAVCRGGCAIDAAQALATDRTAVAPALENLVAHRMLLHTDGPRDEARVGMLETMREYGLERLAEAGEEGDARRRHARQYLAFGEAAAPHMLEADQGVWLARLDREHDNLRAALAWAIDSDEAEVALRLAAALWRYWEIHGHIGEGRRWLDRALTQADGVVPAVHARALYAAARLATLQVDRTAAEDLHRRSYDLYAGSGDRLGQADVLNSWGGLVHGQGEDFARALDLHAQAFGLYAELGHRLGMADALYNQGLVRVLQWDFAGARAPLEQALTMLDDLGDRRGIVQSSLCLGITLLFVPDLPAALAMFRRVLALAEPVGDRANISYGLDGVAAAIGVQGEWECSARLFGTADHIRRDIHFPLPPSYLSLRETAVEAVRGTAPPDAFAAAYAIGEVQPLRASIVQAMGASHSEGRVE